MSKYTRPFADLVADRRAGRITGRGLNIVAAADDPDTTVIRMYDEIGEDWFGGGITAKAVARQLDDITTPNIRVEINSLGGSVFDGIAIMNSLRNHPARVTTRVDGMAASIASVIVQAGDHRQMMDSGQMMVHRAWGLSIGDADDARTLAGILDQQDEVIAGIYSAASTVDSDWPALMQSETWMTAQAAIDYGLADEIVTVARADKPEDRWHPDKFSDRLAAAVAEAETIVEEAKRVSAFRLEQGKPPLGDDSIEHVERLVAALNQLTTPVGDGEPASNADADLDGEFLRFVQLTHI